MDLRLIKARFGPTPGLRVFPRTGEGFRSAVGVAMGQAMDQAREQARHQGPRAEAAAGRWVERTRPVWSWLALEWRRLGTVAAVCLIAGVMLHAMFGANGMVVYRQKHSELQLLQSEVDRLQKENNLYVDQIKSLKSDPAAIEKEAREQLHYTRPGEYVYVAPVAPPKPATGRAKNER